MAKWGEGDPRWIVEQRADSHNVNNWHWRESDATEWSTKYLTKNLLTVKIEDPNLGKICFQKVPVIEGEASCSIRKQKFIFIFDWEKIEIKWGSSSIETDESSVKSNQKSGTIKIVNFDHDTIDFDDLGFSVHFDDLPKELEDQALKKLIQKQAPEKIWKIFESYKDACRSFYYEMLVLSRDKIDKEKRAKEALQMDAIAKNLKTKTSITFEPIASTNSRTSSVNSMINNITNTKCNQQHRGVLRTTSSGGPPKVRVNKTLEKCKSSDVTGVTNSNNSKNN